MDHHGGRAGVSIMAVALALGIGTMIGWRRVATTIGEKIGKKGMTYAQGMSAQMTAAVSIGLASYTGMPVSTTHVLSSSVAGTMVVDGGGLQRKTVTSILMAWVKGMTYAQGMSAQMTAAVSIGLASYTGMPVSTTHVLSSSVAGTMVVDGGGLQRKTVTSILMAWVFTLPAAVLLSGGLYWLSLQFL